MSVTNKVRPIETDVNHLRSLEGDTHAGITSEARRIRREFLCDAAIRLYAMPTKYAGSVLGTGLSEEGSWDLAEALLREGQRRGYLP